VLLLCCAVVLLFELCSDLTNSAIPSNPNVELNARLLETRPEQQAAECSAISINSSSAEQQQEQQQSSMLGRVAALAALGGFLFG
jgi:hypothetical protein